VLRKVLMIEIGAIQAKECIKRALKAKQVPMLHGSPGRGKSSLVEDLCTDYYGRKLYPIVIVLNTYDTVDINGFPQIKEDIAQYVPFNVFPIESTPIPFGYDGWCIFFDEITSASLQLQAAVFRLILNKVVGQHKLHKKVCIIGAGNLASDGAVVSRMSTPMQSRLIHYFYSPTYKEWEDREGANIDYRILSYIQFKPDSLFRFNPKTDLYSFPCERTWGSLSTIIKGNDLDSSYLADICGAIGEAEGRQFYGYCQIFEDLPTIKDILSKPETTHIPTEPSTLYAISGLLTEHLKESNADVLLKYISRLPIEFGVITLRNINKRYPHSITYPAIKDWCKTYSKELFL